MTSLPKALYISHGGGPLPLLGDAGHREMVACLKDIAANIPKPEAIVLVSAHWEEAIPTITAGAAPPLIYDYYGFPPESYEIQYPCTGSPELAKEVQGLLDRSGINAALDEQRGFDHGLFIPLKIMYPEADIPCIQLSLIKTLDPVPHIQMGRALRALSRPNVLIIGSGFSFHNLRAFFAQPDAQSRQQNESFEAWLQETCTAVGISEQKRQETLANWEQAPGARFCHPREEHLLPLHVCCGVSQSPSTGLYKVTIMNRASSMYLWQ